MTVELQPLDVAHVAPLRAIHQQPGVTRWWGPMEAGFPFDEPESTRFAVVVDHEVAGLIQYGEEEWPDHRRAWIDIFIADERTGRGVGTEAVQRVARMLIEERRHHRITIDPAPENVAAVRCYEKAGFKLIGRQSRAYRETRTGQWRDELLMELVTGA